MTTGSLFGGGLGASVRSSASVRVAVVVLAAFGCLGETAQGQNLVPNGSFEDYGACPDSPGQISYCTGWSSFSWTPDYFNACNTNNYFDVPYNALGFQEASSGNGYIGLLTYWEQDLNTREYAGAMLDQPLVPGVEVYISFRLSPAGFGWYTPQTFEYTSNRVGLLFLTQPWAGVDPPITNRCALCTETVLTDTLGWVQVSGVYVPDSAYTYIVLGNFFDDDSTDVQVLDASGLYSGSYAFIDDVTVGLSPMAIADGLLRNESSGLSASPNPSTGVVDLTLTSKYASGLEIVDFQGTVVRAYDFHDRRTVARITLEGLPYGVYCIRELIDQSMSSSTRIVHVPQSYFE